STLVIAINSAGGLVGYGAYVELPWRFLLAFTGVAIAGIVAGTYLAEKVSQTSLRRAFGVFLLIVGALMLYDRGRAVFASRAAGVDEGTALTS
ncbi:MAG: sulfite exporter TauE/SafE family protein, partial [Gemmatimonadota bacterium]|nr:sulfite exporter TauE/SafE family protein [Gemmatimonadota bacterium]